jgi:cell division protein FtsW (lipid II flippase)
MKLMARWQEFKLLLVIAITAVSGTFFIYYTGGQEKEILYKFGLLIGLLFLIHIILIVRGHGTDQFLFPISALLSILGLLGIYRVDPQMAMKQWLWIILGQLAFCFVIIFFKNYRKLEDYKFIFMVLAIFFLLITVLLGVKVSGARAWLELGGFRFQPAEIVKLLVILFLASYLREIRSAFQIEQGEVLKLLLEPRAITPILFMVIASLGLLAIQKDLGAALIFFGIFLVMLYTSTGSIMLLATGLGIFSFGAVIAYYIFGHIRIRVWSWLDPWSRIDESGYQITQSLFALASGGIVGSGYGLGQPQVIPAAATDLIFAVLTEELGLLGGIGIILLLLLLSYRGFRIALMCGDNFGILLATGVTTLFALQSFIILSGVTKLLPLTGVTLPFVSYGGSSMLISYILLGLLMNVGRRSTKNEA